MARYIKAELIEKHINRAEHHTPDERWRPESEFAALIDSIPTADVAEVVHGEWIKHKPAPEVMRLFHQEGIAEAMSENSIYWTCSECGSWGTPIHKYCPECGAKMDAKKMEQMTYCDNRNCPFKDCKKHLSKCRSTQKVTVADFYRVCRRYIAWALKEVEK